MWAASQDQRCVRLAPRLQELPFQGDSLLVLYDNSLEKEQHLFQKSGE